MDKEIIFKEYEKVKDDRSKSITKKVEEIAKKLELKAEDVAKIICDYYLP